MTSKLTLGSRADLECFAVGDFVDSGDGTTSMVVAINRSDLTVSLERPTRIRRFWVWLRRLPRRASWRARCAWRYLTVRGE